MLNNFFRKDLNLKSHWWHRLLSVVFTFSFIIFVIYYIALFSTSDMFRGGQVQQWRKVGTLSERITSEVKPIGALVRAGEKIGENDRAHTLNDKPNKYYTGITNDVYCSTQLYNNFEQIKAERKTKNLFIRNLYGNNDVTPETFANYIKQNNIYCIVVDAYTTYDTNAQVAGKLSFLEPVKEYQDNWSLYEKSTIITTIYFLEMIPAVIGISLIFFSTIIFMYYKIILYIIFGSKNGQE